MLTKNLKLAIQDCAQYRHGYYIWKPSSMKKLESLGYARKIPHAEIKNRSAWEITNEGHKAFEKANNV